MNAFKFCVCMHERNEGGYFFTVKPHISWIAESGNTYYRPVRGYVTQHKTEEAAKGMANRFNKGVLQPARWPMGGLLDEEGNPKPWVIG